MLYGEYMADAGKNAAALIDAMDLQQFYGDVFLTWGLAEQKLRNQAKSDIVKDLRRWIPANHGA